MSYQYMSALCYREIYLLRFIFCYFTLIYNKYVNLLGFICPSSQNSTYHTNFESIGLSYFVTQFFAAYKYIYDLSKASITDTNKTFKYRDISGGRPIRFYGDREYDLYRLDSVILRQYTTVTNQC